jgi:hypothetical protein
MAECGMLYSGSGSQLHNSKTNEQGPLKHHELQVLQKISLFISYTG